jgi:hypothetical protein
MGVPESPEATDAIPNKLGIWKQFGLLMIISIDHMIRLLKVAHQSTKPKFRQTGLRRNS